MTVLGMIRSINWLVLAADELACDADRCELRATARQIRGVRATLDAVRTRLVEEGDAYMDTALAFRTTASEYLVTYAARIGAGGRNARA